MIDCSALFYWTSTCSGLVVVISLGNIDVELVSVGDPGCGGESAGRAWRGFVVDWRREKRALFFVLCTYHLSGTVSPEWPVNAGTRRAAYLWCIRGAAISRGKSLNSQTGTHSLLGTSPPARAAEECRLCRRIEGHTGSVALAYQACSSRLATYVLYEKNKTMLRRSVMGIVDMNAMKQSSGFACTWTARL